MFLEGNVWLEKLLFALDESRKCALRAVAFNQLADNRIPQIALIELMA